MKPTTDFRGSGRARVRAFALRMAAIATCVTQMVVAVAAVGENKALYVGGSSKEFPSGGIAPRVLDDLARNRVSKLEGTLSTQSQSDLVFDAGKNGQLSIPYSDMTALTFDLDSHCPKGCLVVIGWDPLEQYSSTKTHYLLSITYRSKTGEEHGTVFELGKKVRRQILADLETRTGLTLQFGDVEACLLHRSADECGYGTAAELRGLSTVYLDAVDDEDRQLIIAELTTSQLRLQIAEHREAADVVLSFRGERFNRPDHLQTLYGGRGRVRILRSGRTRTVLLYAGTRLRPFGAKPATKFAEEFVRAYRSTQR